MKKTFIFLVALLAAFVLCACHQHNWVEPNCTTPRTCSDCSEIAGTAPGHNWNSATCTTPKTCLDCGKTDGNPTGHTWKDATCTTPKTCKNCNMTDGATLEHSWEAATCTVPMTCLECGQTEGAPVSHTWKDATCTTPETCESCGMTDGAALGHSWETVNVYTKKCKTCEIQEIDQSKLPVSLVSLKPSSSGYYYSGTDKEDIYGNKFSDGLSFLVNHYGPAEENSTEYVLNRMYTKFTTILMVDSGSKDTFECRLKIYVDDILVYDNYSLTKKTQATNIEIDITNAMFIRIETTGIDGSGYVMLEDPLLHY